MRVQVFQVNKYITLSLEEGETNIYVNGELFNQCRYVLVRKTLQDMKKILSIETVDELVDNLDTVAETEEVDISPATKFWVHCSNIQVWVENNYDTRLLHSNLSFPLLKRLVEAGDKQAIKAFKEEIIKRYKIGNYKVRKYLKEENYLSYLTQDELLFGLLRTNEALALESISKKTNISYDVVPVFGDLRKRRTYSNRKHFRIDNGYLTGLEVVLSNKHAEFPQDMEQFEKIHQLKLYLRNLNKIIPKFNMEIKSLVDLEIFCYGRVIIPNMFDKFPNLQCLEITTRDKAVFKGIPETIGVLSDLETLDIYSVYMEELPKSMRNLNKLKWLSVRNTNLRKIDEDVIKLKNLEALDLTGNPNLNFPKKYISLEKFKLLNLDELIDY